MKLSISTSSVEIFDPESAFKAAKDLGYDGVEIMVSPGSKTQSASKLKDYINHYQIPVTSIHAPTLLLCKFVWGMSPAGKLKRSVEFAQEVGASKVVVHPPMRWSSYAGRFVEYANELERDTGVNVCIENMFPWKIANREREIYGPDWETTTQQASSLTFDFSHAAASSMNIIEQVERIHDKIKIIHLCDGSTRNYKRGDAVMDEHLIPGEGDMPIREVYQTLQSVGWDNDTTLEVNTRNAKTYQKKMEMLEKSISFFRSITS